MIYKGVVALVVITKLNGWVLDHCHYIQKSLPAKDKLPLLNFSTEIPESPIDAKTPSTSRSRSNERTRLESLLAVPKKKGGRNPGFPTPCLDVRYGKICHWLFPLDDKRRCFQCQAYRRMSCFKCSV